VIGAGYRFTHLWLQFGGGAAQSAVFTQGPPQAVTMLEPVRSWQTEFALAERTAAIIAAVTTFFTMVLSLYLLAHFVGEGGGPSGWQTPVVPPPRPKKQPHGRLQISPLVQGLPHATIA
jgi:hypothetical protein